MSIALRDFATSSKRGLAVAAMALSVFGMNSNALAAGQCLPGVYTSPSDIKVGACFTKPELDKAITKNGYETIVKGHVAGDNPNLQLVMLNAKGQGVVFETDALQGSGKKSTQGTVMSVLPQAWSNTKPGVPYWAHLTGYNKLLGEYICKEKPEDGCGDHNELMQQRVDGGQYIVFGGYEDVDYKGTREKIFMTLRVKPGLGAQFDVTDPKSGANTVQYELRDPIVTESAAKLEQPQRVAGLTPR